jgi:hypothetical protein
MYVTDHMWWHSAYEFKVVVFIIKTQNHSLSRILRVRPELNFLHKHTSHMPWFSKNDPCLHSHTSFVTLYAHFLYFLGLLHSASVLLIQECLLWTVWLWFISPCETCLLNSQPWYSLQMLAVIDICIEKCHIEHTPPVPPSFRMAV